MGKGMSTLIGMCECGAEECTKAISVHEYNPDEFSVSIVDVSDGEVLAGVVLSKSTLASWLYGLGAMVNQDVNLVPIVDKCHTVQ